MISEASRPDTEGRYELYDALDSLSFSDNSFDIIFSSWVILEQGSCIQLSVLDFLLLTHHNSTIIIGYHAMSILMRIVLHLFQDTKSKLDTT